MYNVKRKKSMNVLKMCKKILLFGGTFVFFGNFFAAGLNLSTQFTTHADVVFTNNVTRSVDVYPGSLERIDAFFEGFKEIRWQGMDGKMYKAGLDIKGIESWIALQIRTDNAITVNRLNQRIQEIFGTPY